MLRIAWALYLAGIARTLRHTMAELGASDAGVSARRGDGQPHAADLTSETVGAPGGVRVDDTAALTGEWFLLSSYREFPDIPKMVEILEVAGLLLRGRSSQVVLPSAPWWFGRMSAAIDWNVIPGEAERVGEELEKFVALYTKLTNGHGSGADLSTRPACIPDRGDLSGAEVHATKHPSWPRAGSRATYSWRRRSSWERSLYRKPTLPGGSTRWIPWNEPRHTPFRTHPC
jgi:hypothetical protein